VKKITIEVQRNMPHINHFNVWLRHEDGTFRYKFTTDPRKAIYELFADQAFQEYGEDWKEKIYDWL